MSEHDGRGEEDDATRLASRRAEAGVDEPEDDATRLSMRRVEGAPADEPEDDATRLAVRRGPSRPEPAGDGTSSLDDSTRVSAPAARRRTTAALPPGVPLGEVTTSGTFGQHRDSYGPRPTPPPSAPPSPAPASATPGDSTPQVLSRAEVEARRARQRRRKIVVGATGAAIGAAGLTVIVVLGVNLLGGGA